MREWGFALSAEELEAVAAAARLYRDHCDGLRLPTRATFDGSIDDVLTLDYLAYEGLEPRGAGIESAALVCGEVLRREAGLEWWISYRGDWLVASREDSPHEFAICPLARLHELECGGRRGGASGMHLWFIQQAAVACIPVLDGETERNVRDLLGGGGYYLGFVEKALAQLRTSSGSGRPTQGRP